MTDPMDRIVNALLALASLEKDVRVMAWTFHGRIYYDVMEFGSSIYCTENPGELLEYVEGYARTGKSVYQAPAGLRG